MASARLGVVLVHFHTPHLVDSAVAALRADAAGSDLGVEILVVDNGSTAEEREHLREIGERHAVPIVDPGENLGYAGGVNHGADRLGVMDVLVAMNPDVRVQPGCLPALVSALSEGAGVVGPRFYWDSPGGFSLPPAEERGRLHSLRRFLALRSTAAATRARRLWRRHARRHWLARRPLASHALSGALLAIDTAAWRRVGRFDEAYSLYFEETDWLERARRAGVAGHYVPAAEAVHAYAQSTIREPRAAAWFEASHARFRRQHYGVLWSLALEKASRLWPARSMSLPGAGSPSSFDSVRWLEIASSPLGFPAATRRVDRLTPGEALVPASADPGVYFVRGLDAEDRELWSTRLEVAPTAKSHAAGDV